MRSNHPPQVIYLHPAKQRVEFPFGDPRFQYVAAFQLLPVGVVGLASVLRREGIRVRGLNYPAERFIDPGFDLRAWLSHVGPARLVLIDLHWYEHSFGALDVARVCKQVLPSTPVVIGGMTASLYAREILEGFPWVDYVIRGNAEEPLRQLALRHCQGDVPHHDLGTIPNLSYRLDDQVIENALSYRASSTELDSLNFADIGFLEHSRRYFGFQFVGRRSAFIPSEEPRLLGHWLSIGRGCVFDCSFCGGGQESHYALAGRQGLVMRSVNAVVDDIEALRDRGVLQVALSLDPAVMGKPYWAELFAELSRRRVRIGIYNEAFQLPPPEFVEAYAECAALGYSELALSVLSGDERVRRMHGKFYSNQELLALIRTLRRHKVPIAIYYSFNLPGENEASLRKTLFLTQRIGRSYPSHLLAVYNQPHTLDPCSPMSRNPEEYDIEISLRSFSDYFDYCRNTAVERPGVLGMKGRGFRWRGRTRETERRMQQLWLDFSRRQRHLCF